MKGEGEEEKVSLERLNALHQILEREWDSFERSFKSKTHRRRFSGEALQLVQNSPGALVPSIQQSQQTWNVRNNELALDETLTDKIGRRLFTEKDEMGLGTMLISFPGHAETIQTRSLSESDSGEENQDLGGSPGRPSCSSPEEENERHKTAPMGEGRSCNNGGQRFRIFRGFVAAVTSAIFGFCMFSIRKIGENEEILVPT